MRLVRGDLVEDDFGITTKILEINEIDEGAIVNFELVYVATVRKPRALACP